MTINYVPLDKAIHKDLKLAAKPDYSYTQNTHIAAASIREYPQLSTAMPIVFIKDESTGNHHSVAMLGVEQQKNLYLHEGKWQAPQVPMNIQRYPFDIRPDGDKLGLYIDENSSLLSTEEGNPLFNEDGNPGDVLQNRLNFMDLLANSERLTAEFIQKMVELELLTAIEIRYVTVNNERRTITGMLGIDEPKLLDLPDADVLALHKKGFLGAVYAVMMSLGQLNRLVELSNNTDSPIRSLQIVNLAQEAAAKAKAEAEAEVKQ
jgi:hypothetical protein